MYGPIFLMFDICRREWGGRRVTQDTSEENPSFVFLHCLHFAHFFSSSGVDEVGDFSPRLSRLLPFRPLV